MTFQGPFEPNYSVILWHKEENLSQQSFGHAVLEPY